MKFSKDTKQLIILTLMSLCVYGIALLISLMIVVGYCFSGVIKF